MSSNFHIKEDDWFTCKQLTSHDEKPRRRLDELSKGISTALKKFTKNELGQSYVPCPIFTSEIQYAEDGTPRKPDFKQDGIWQYIINIYAKTTGAHTEM